MSVGRKCRTSAALDSSDAISRCRWCRPRRTDARTSWYSALATLASARSSARVDCSTANAVKICSTSTTLGSNRPVSIRLTLLWLMPHRRASRSPDRPDAFRRPWSALARSRRSCPAWLGSTFKRSDSSGMNRRVRQDQGQGASTPRMTLDRCSLGVPVLADCHRRHTP
jgi:hypothetical protein